MMILQTSALVPTNPLQLVLMSSFETKLVLAVTLVFSLASWFLIGSSGASGNRPPDSSWRWNARPGCRKPTAGP